MQNSAVETGEFVQSVQALWPAPDNIIAFTTIRRGGVSRLPYDSLNLGAHVGDDFANVRQNRELLMRHFNLPSEPVWLRQTHSTKIIEIKPKTAVAQTADGAVTSIAGLICCVMTADCMPLFICNKAGNKLGVVHVGWRGMANGIIERGITALNELPEEILAWAGPTISAQHFKVGIDVRRQLGGSEDAYSLSKNEGKWYADLYKLAGQRLAKQGVRSYGHADACTYADRDRFFSHRRDQQTGRMASIIYRSDKS